MRVPRTYRWARAGRPVRILVAAPRFPPDARSGAEQALQRLLISERAGILRARAQLLRALGGSWTEELKDPMAAAASPETPQAPSTLGPR